MLNEVVKVLKTHGSQYHGLYTIILSDTWIHSHENLLLLKEDVTKMIIGSKTQSDLIDQIRKESYRDVHMLSVRVHNTRPLTRQVIEERIISENSKLGEYSKLVQETWLVLTVCGVKASDRRSFVEPDIFASYYTHFKKVFILNLFRSKIYALKVQSPVKT